MLNFESVTVEDVPVVSGFVNGVVTYITGFVASIALYAVVGTNTLTTISFAGLSPGAEFGFVFYGGHLVPITDGTQTLNYATQVADAGGLFVLLVVLLLLSTGYSVASKDGVPDDRRAKVLAGASLVTGYLPLAILGGLYFTGTTDGVTLSLSLPQVVFFAGILLPAGLGALGGYAASQAS